MNSKIMIGDLHHIRFAPVRHEFHYPMYTYVLDLDELDEIAREIPLFSHNRWNVVSILDGDYVLGGSASIRERILEFLKKSGRTQPIGKIQLVTGARYFGHVFNPVSFYYCFSPEGSLAMIVAEVNNTVGERHFYILDDPKDTRPGFIAHYRHAVEFFISPFIKKEGEYEFYFSGLDEKFDCQITDYRNGGKFFFARLSGKLIPLTKASLTKTLLHYPLTAGLTIPRILWQAIILFFVRKIPIVNKPEPVHPMTFHLARPSRWQRKCRKLVFGLLSALEKGRLKLVLPDKSEQFFGGKVPGREGVLRVYNNNFFSRIVRSGDIGFGESFMAGEWDSENVTALLELFIDNQEAIDRYTVKYAGLGNFINTLKHLFRRNTLKGSRKNISEHYDLSNDFYETFLDPTMTYSCGIFKTPQDTLETAQRSKLASIIQKADIKPGSHILEIGCGWGSFAIETAKRTNCRVTCLTLSAEQKKLAELRVREAGLAGKITILLEDYRKMTGSFDRIVSIEMLEAVGHEYLGEYFRVCSRLLAPEGRCVIQVITIPDHRYDDYRKRADWIQKHIFPGGHLPSRKALQDAMAKDSDLVIESIENIGPHYANTLALWRECFKKNASRIKELGFDEIFQRKWEYYFSYCEAGFATQTLDVLQLVLKHSKS